MNHFSLTVSNAGILELRFDVPGAKVNTLGSAVWNELDRLLDGLEPRTDLGGLLFRSGKPGQFVAGADLKEVAALAWLTPRDALPGIRFGKRVLDRIAALPFPTVALIDGPAMGGGFELALAFDARIVSDSPRTILGLPEVNLGVIPAWGGTQRLPRLVGVGAALEILADPVNLSAARAVELGVASARVPADGLEQAGVAELIRLRAGDHWRGARERRSGPAADLHQPAVAEIIRERRAREASRARERAEPARSVVVAAAAIGSALTLAEGQEIETDQALRVFGSRASGNLISLFFDRQAFDRQPIGGAVVEPITAIHDPSGLFRRTFPSCRLPTVDVAGLGPSAVAVVDGRGPMPVAVPSGVPTLTILADDDGVPDGSVPLMPKDAGIVTARVPRALPGSSTVVEIRRDQAPGAVTAALADLMRRSGAVLLPVADPGGSVLDTLRATFESSCSRELARGLAPASLRSALPGWVVLDSVLGPRVDQADSSMSLEGEASDESAEGSEAAERGGAVRRRLLTPVLVEAARFLERGVIGSVRDLDVALVAAWVPGVEGGIFRFADQETLPALLDQWRADAASGQAAPFDPPALLSAAASAGARFHPRPDPLPAFAQPSR
jgi:enoyl-CoA hydratase/carnithine racemase